MAVEWAGATTVQVDYFTEPGVLGDKFGNVNDGPALAIGNGEDGIVVEGTREELLGFVSRLYTSLVPARTQGLDKDFSQA